MRGVGPYFDPEIPAKSCRNCGKPAALLGYNAALFPGEEIDHPSLYYPLCIPCSQIGREEV